MQSVEVLNAVKIQNNLGRVIIEQNQGGYYPDSYILVTFSTMVERLFLLKKITWHLHRIQECAFMT